jgi:RimJ/RimL family protein N-acetyltransferase
VVTLKASQESAGIITYIKRDYLEHPDIGFAFLPAFAKSGYAYEATNGVLNKLISEDSLTNILAITVPGNIDSIKLLKKVGLVFEKEIEVENKTVQIWGRTR